MPFDKQTMIRLQLDPPILAVWFILATPNPESARKAPTEFAIMLDLCILKWT
jgi:hypothetical protein